MPSAKGAACGGDFRPAGAGARGDNGPPRLIVQGVLQDLAGLERQHAARADRDLLPSLRVAAGPRVLVAHHEVPEAGDLDLLSALEGLLDGVEYRLDDLCRF